MFLHPANLLFMTSLMFSIIIMVSTNSWLTSWLALEINLMSFIPLMLKKNSKYSTESTLKYFLFQAITSIIFILLVINYKKDMSLMNILIMIIFLMKTGCAPFHQWVPAMSEGLLWSTLFILLTAQKTNPLILLNIMYKTHSTNNIIYLAIISSAFIGAAGALNQTSIMKITIYSSISHLAWIMSGMMISSFIWSVYFLLYILILIPLIWLMSDYQTFSLTQILVSKTSNLSLMSSCALLSLGGLPPFSGFLPKIIIMQELIQSQLYHLLIILLLSSFISLFFYIRITLIMLMFSSMSFNSLNIIKTPSFTSKNIMNWMGLLMPSLMFLIILSFKLFKL